MTIKVTILGCGGATGTPSINGGWGACDPENPKNRRSRPSILVETADTTILVDASPDLRAQLLASGTRKLDAVLFTHIHADHTHGIDDLRDVNRAMGAPIAAYGDAETLGPLTHRFAYVFEPLPKGTNFYFKPTLEAHEIRDGQDFQIGSIPVQAFAQDHGYCTSIGFRLGPVAYSTDVVRMPDAAFDALAGVEGWIVGALRDEPHPTHAHVEKALEWAARIGPRTTVLTHLSPDLDHGDLSARLPEGVVAGYDGLVLEFPFQI